LAAGGRMTGFARFDLSAFADAKGKDRCAKSWQLDEICRETGFLILTGHGVPADVIAGVRPAAVGLFARWPGAKAAVAAPCSGYPCG